MDFNSYNNIFSFCLLTQKKLVIVIKYKCTPYKHKYNDMKFNTGLFQISLALYTLI